MSAVHRLRSVGRLLVLAHAVAVVQVAQRPFFQPGGDLFPGLLRVVGELPSLSLSANERFSGAVFELTFGVVEPFAIRLVLVANVVGSLEVKVISADGLVLVFREPSVDNLHHRVVRHFLRKARLVQPPKLRIRRDPPVCPPIVRRLASLSSRNRVSRFSIFALVRVGIGPAVLQLGIVITAIVRVKTFLHLSGEFLQIVQDSVFALLGPRQVGMVQNVDCQLVGESKVKMKLIISDANPKVSDFRPPVNIKPDIANRIRFASHRI
jgi:hypothetical protein